MASKSKPEKKKKEKKEIDETYNEFKDFEGKKYTGMTIGRGHKWQYEAGEWKETKKTPDLWVFNYNVKKQRAGKAPEGSGVPVGHNIIGISWRIKMWKSWMPILIQLQ